MAIKNFNRIIDITLSKKTKYDSTGALGLAQTFIRTPRSGRKPDIEISGQILPSDQVSLFEIKIKNLYDTKIVQDLSQVQVVAGYAENNSAVFTGTPINVYTNSPGPDRETVIQCSTADFGAWTNTIVDLKLRRPGWTLKEAVSKINKALGFGEPIVGVKAALLTCQAPWDFTGTAKEAAHMLSKLFPNISVTITDNRIRVLYDPDRASQVLSSVKTYKLPYLSTAPQFSGGDVTLTAPWDPAIKPGDRVQFSSNFYTASNSLLMGAIKQTTEIEVIQIGFIFGTTGQANQMTIQGILPQGGTK